MVANSAEHIEGLLDFASIPIYIIQLLHAVMGSMLFWPPPQVVETHRPHHSMQHSLCYTKVLQMPFFLGGGTP